MGGAKESEESKEGNKGYKDVTKYSEPCKGDDKERVILLLSLPEGIVSHAPTVEVTRVDWCLVQWSETGHGRCEHTSSGGPWLQATIGNHCHKLLPLYPS